MSHITDLRTAVKFRDEGTLLAALDAVSRDLPNFTYEVSTDAKCACRKVQVQYPPIERYQRRGNLQFVQDVKTGEFVMRADYWKVEMQMRDVKKRVEVAYQHEGVREVAARLRYSTRTQTLDAGHMAVYARRA